MTRDRKEIACALGVFIVVCSSFVALLWWAVGGGR